MKTTCLALSTFALLAQVAADAKASDAATLLDYGGLGALILVLAAVFLKLLPAHQATVEKQAESHRLAAEKISEAHCDTVSTLVKEHKEGLRLIANAHERACDKIVNEIKTCRMGKA